MVSATVANKMIKNYYDRVGNDSLRIRFAKVLNFLVDHKVSKQVLYEFYHEFGHHTKIVELKGTSSYLKVDMFLFRFKQDRVFVSNQDNNASFCLGYFIDRDPKTFINNFEKVAFEGMKFSQSLLLFSISNSLSGAVFNMVNSPYWPFYRKGSDQYLYKYQWTLGRAIEFNLKSIEYEKKLEQTILEYREV